jgi:nucleotide-binding universal stress UspA family protein
MRGECSLGRIDRMPGSHQHDHHPPTGLCIVAGYDGSPASKRAIEQAAYDAGPLGRVVVGSAGAATSEHLQATIDVPALVRTRWHAESLDGPAAEALVRLAADRDADRIHVGTRGLGEASGVLGSVAERVLELSDRPVLVFPERAVVRESARLHAEV